MEPEVVYAAKKIAKERSISLSKLVENYLRTISNSKEQSKVDSIEISDWVKSLIAVDKPTPDFDHKAEYHKHLEDKYGK